MKERSLLYFITAVIASVLFLVSIVIRSFEWFSTYGYAVMPTMFALFIPAVILWVGWFYQNKGFLLSGSIVVAVLLGLQFDTVGILSGTPFVLATYAPMVKTTFVLGVILMIATSGIGFYTYMKLSLPKQ